MDHVLATRIYDASRCSNAKPGYQGMDVPYVDLYGFEENPKGTISVQAHNPKFLHSTIFPVSTVNLLGGEYYTIAKPVEYFKAVHYGDYKVERDDGYK